MRIVDTAIESASVVSPPRCFMSFLNIDLVAIRCIHCGAVFCILVGFLPIDPSLWCHSATFIVVPYITFIFDFDLLAQTTSS